MTPASSRRPFSEGLKGVVFDLDDTLVLSTVDYVRFKKLIIDRIALEGEDPDKYDPTEGIMRLIGRFRRSMESKGRSELETGRVLMDIEAIMDGVEMERVRETRGIPGAKELLQTLRERGLMIGVLTRGCERYATAVLEMTGMLDLVDEIECRNSEVPPKPSPEPYWRVVRRLGLEVGDTVFVGDHYLDAACAREAGVRFIGVRTGDLTDEQLRDAGSVEVLESVADMIAWFDDGSGDSA